jgi:hypothetical protein
MVGLQRSMAVYGFDNTVVVESSRELIDAERVEMSSEVVTDYFAPYYGHKDFLIHLPKPR